MTKYSKPARLVIADLDQGIISEGRIQAMRKAYGTLERKRQGWSTSVTSSGMSPDEFNMLIMRIEKERPRITGKQAEKGLAYLRNLHKSPLGKIRKNNPFDETQALAISEEHFSHFTLQGFEEVNQNAYHTILVPVYRVHAPHIGASFAYMNSSWQTGLPFEIL